MSIQVVILAAGKGKRMHSHYPKVLHTLAGKPLLEHVILKAIHLAPDVAPLIVSGHQSQQLQKKLGHYPVRWIEQPHQLGTGHALLQALPSLLDDSQVLVLYGDVPLIALQTLQTLIKTTPPEKLGMLTATLMNPSGYGRIKRDAKQHIIGIIEDKDATPEEKIITEINPGIYFVAAHFLKKWLPQLTQHNAQGEYYLTDIIALAVQEHIAIHAVQPNHIEEILGVNDCAQLAFVERYYQRQCAEKLMQQGVTLIDPNRFDIRGEVSIGRDVTIDVNVILEGRIIIGDNCVIGPNTLLRDVELQSGVEVKANCVLEGAKIASDARIGPFSRIRPGTELKEGVHIGNFVEIKNSHIAENSKVNHLTYLGDSDVGKAVNIGAGTITCNYDGLNKHKTTIGDDAFIGSNTELIAPVTIGQGATIGAGSTITHDAPPNQLTLARSPQISIAHWKRPVPEENKR